MIKEHDMVKVVVTSGQLRAGMVGTVVHVYPGGTLEVEFPGEKAVVTISQDKVKLVPK